MKIEKLTENKIRIIINSDDLNIEHIDIHSLINKSLEGESFFTNILEKAKKEVGFNFDGCKLLIEAFSSSDDIVVFTITKYNIASQEKNDNPLQKRLKVKRKTLDASNLQAIYCCKNFETFCDFCECLTKNADFNIKSFSKKVLLYFYNDTYYLLLKNINISYKGNKFFYSLASEFLTPVNFSNNFESKLIEYGKVIMKNNAIITATKYFIKSNI